MSHIKTSNIEQELFDRGAKVIPGGASRNILLRKPHPFYVDRASGCYIYDVNGNKKIDFANNVASLIHGHAHPKILEAVFQQINKGTSYTLATQVEVEYAELMCNRVPSYDKIRFMNSGTEAVMCMIKAARAFTGKPMIAKAEGGYHGSYDTAEVSQSATPATWGDIDEPERVAHVVGTPKEVLDNVVIFPYNDTERTIRILDKYAGKIACVLVDPVPHRLGLNPGSQEFIEALYSWTRRNNALLCFDEVICFRVEYEGAQSLYNIKPDLTSMGKIIGGGFPIGAFAGRSDVMDVLNPDSQNYRFPLSGTFSANPVSLVAGKIAMEMFDREAITSTNYITSVAREQILEAGKIAGIPLRITGTGSMIQIHFTNTPPKTYRDLKFDAESKVLNSLFLDHLYEQGVIIINSRTCVFSTVITQKEVDVLTEAMLSAFKHIKPQLEEMNIT